MVEQGCVQTNQLDEELVELTSEISLKQKLIEELGKYILGLMGNSIIELITRLNLLLFNLLYLCNLMG